MTKKERIEILTILSILESYKYDDCEEEYFDIAEEKSFSDPIDYVCHRLRKLYNKTYKPSNEKQKADVIEGSYEIIA